MAGKFGSVGLLASFIHSTKDSDRRFRTNIEAIIQKYEQPDPNDAIIDLRSFQILTSEDSLENRKTCHFGLSKLATTQRRERNQTANSTNLDGRTPQTMSDSFSSDEINASIAEENCTKVFSFICVNDNDPSDAETLSSCSTKSDESWEEFDSQSRSSEGQQTPADPSKRKSGKNTEAHENLPGSDSDSVFVNKSWYSLRKSASISSNSSGISKPGQKKPSDVCKPDCLPLNNTTASTRKKLLIHKKLKQKNVSNLDHSMSLNKLDIPPDSKCCTSPVENSIEYEASSEDSAFGPCQDPPCLSYKADIVRAWVNDQQENRANTELCETGVFSCSFGQNNAVDKVRIKTEVQDDGGFDAAVKMHANHKSDSSVESNATYIIPKEKESLHWENNPNLYDDYQAGGTICAEMSFECVHSPQKQSTSLADATMCVKKSTPCSTSRRILRARKRFKPPLLSMTEQQLQEFFDSSHPDFTMFYASSSQEIKDTVSDGYTTKVEDAGIISDFDLKCRKHKQRFEGNSSSFFNTNKQIIKNQETKFVHNNYLNDDQLPKKSVLQPTKLQFSTVCAKNMLEHTSNKGVINSVGADLTATRGNRALNIHENVIEHDATQNKITTDATFVVPPSVGSCFERLENMLEQGRTLKSLKQVIQSVTSDGNKTPSKILCQSSIQSDAEKLRHSEQNCLSTSNSFTVGFDDELSSDSTSSEQNLFSTNGVKNVLKRSERGSVRTSQKALEMSPVSRLSSLRLSSPISSRKMTVVSSAKKMKETDKCCLRVQNTSGVAVFSGSFPKAAINSNIFSSCPKNKLASDVSLGCLKTRKANNSQLPKSHRHRDRSHNYRETNTNSSDHKLLKHHQAVVSSVTSSKSLNSKTTFHSDHRLKIGKIQIPEHWCEISQMLKDNSNGLLNLHYNLQYPGVHDLNLMNRGSMQKNIHVKRLQKHTSTPIKRRVDPVDMPRFLNETLSTIADTDVNMIEQIDDEDQIVTLSP